MKMKFGTLFNRRESTNILYIPALLLFSAFTFYPLISGIQLSFTNWDGYNVGKEFIGFENYISLISDQYFHKVLINTLIFGVGCTVFQQIFGLVLALILDSKIKGKNIARAIIYMPVLVSPVIMGVMYYMLVQYNNGPLNDLVILFGGEKIAWLSDENISLAIIVAVNTIQFMGISMILYLAGLQNIPDMYYEAASIDGATGYDRFKHITLPLLYPAMVTSITLNLIGGLKLFDIIKVLTNGGPGYSTNSVSTFLHLTYFSGERAGYASSMGVVLFVMILIVTLLLNISLNRKEVDF
jgi:raffinose/stachyose/melibiose transport system permease protein